MSIFANFIDVSQEHFYWVDNLKQMPDIGMFEERVIDRDKLFLNHKMLDLLLSEGHG